MTFFPCCCETFGSGGVDPGGECCTLADTLLAGNTTGGTSIVVSTGDVISGESTLILQAADDTILSPGPAGSAYVNGGPIITDGVNAGPPSDANIIIGTSTPGTNGTQLVFRRLTAGANMVITQNADDIVFVAAGNVVDTLAQTLVAGNTTGGTDVIVSAGDQIQGATNLLLTAANDVRLLPTGTGTALAGTQTIITTCSSSGGGASVVRVKDLGTNNGANQTFRSFTSVGGTVTIVQNPDTINLEAAGGAFSSGSEIAIDIQGIGVVASTVRQTVVRGRQIGATQVSFNLGAGTADVSIVYRSLVAGQTTTARARNIWGRSNLGNTFLNGLTGVVTTTSTSFTAICTMNVNAGNWVISAGVDLETPP